MCPCPYHWEGRRWCNTSRGPGEEEVEGGGGGGGRREN